MKKKNLVIDVVTELNPIALRTANTLWSFAVLSTVGLKSITLSLFSLSLSLLHVLYHHYSKYSKILNASFSYKNAQANSVDPDQSASEGAV